MTGGTIPHPNVDRAKRIKLLIHQRSGCNIAEDDKFLDDISEIEAEVEVNQQFDPHTAETHTFIRQQSATPPQSATGAFNATRQLSTAPPPSTIGSFNVSKAVAWESQQAQYQSMMEMFAYQRQQALEDERRFRLEEQRRREEREAEEARRREERDAEEARRRQQAAEDEAQRRAEDRRDMQAFIQATLTALLAVTSNRKDDRKYDHDRDQEHD
jgi:hypothetical protein